MSFFGSSNKRLFTNYRPSSLASLLNKRFDGIDNKLLIKKELNDLKDSFLYQISSSCDKTLIEICKNAESVHPIVHDKDMERRLNNSLVYVLSHPLLKDQSIKYPHIKNERLLVNPMAVTFVHLSSHTPNSIHTILDSSIPVSQIKEASHATFYAIAITSPSFASLDIPKHLLLKAIQELKNKYNCKVFRTLSPMPTFKKWLIQESISNTNAKKITSLPHSWYKESNKETHDLFMEMGNTYLNANGKCNDPVGNFHLSNGASIYRLNFLADMTDKGMEESMGLMVNYEYPSNNSS